MKKKKILLKGISASRGRVKGTVRIVLGDASSSEDFDILAKDLLRVKKGDVLVTEMTRPPFVMAMRRAVAIVTDRGGILCHAAMVSREFGIPCIVATEEATRVLKDGQKVFVDATKGIVYAI